MLYEEAFKNIKACKYELKNNVDKAAATIRVTVWADKIAADLAAVPLCRCIVQTSSQLAANNEQKESEIDLDVQREPWQLW